MCVFSLFLQKNGQISSMTSLNGPSEDNTMAEGDCRVYLLFAGGFFVLSSLCLCLRFCPKQWRTCGLFVCGSVFKCQSADVKTLPS